MKNQDNKTKNKRTYSKKANRPTTPKSNAPYNPYATPTKYDVKPAELVFLNTLPFRSTILIETPSTQLESDHLIYFMLMLGECYRRGIGFLDYAKYMAVNPTRLAPPNFKLIDVMGIYQPKIDYYILDLADAFPKRDFDWNQAVKDLTTVWATFCLSKNFKRGFTADRFIGRRLMVGYEVLLDSEISGRKEGVKSRQPVEIQRPSALNRSPPLSKPTASSSEVSRTDGPDKSTGAFRKQITPKGNKKATPRKQIVDKTSEESLTENVEHQSLDNTYEKEVDLNLPSNVSITQDQSLTEKMSNLTISKADDNGEGSPSVDLIDLSEEESEDEGGEINMDNLAKRLRRIQGRKGFGDKPTSSSTILTIPELLNQLARQFTTMETADPERMNRFLGLPESTIMEALTELTSNPEYHWFRYPTVALVTLLKTSKYTKELVYSESLTPSEIIANLHADLNNAMLLSILQSEVYDSNIVMCMNIPEKDRMLNELMKKLNNIEDCKVKSIQLENTDKILQMLNEVIGLIKSSALNVPPRTMQQLTQVEPIPVIGTAREVVVSSNPANLASTSRSGPLPSQAGSSISVEIPKENLSTDMVPAQGSARQVRKMLSYGGRLNLSTS